MSGSAAGSPAVSIIMPVHNTGEILRDTIGHVLSQKWEDFELLLVDDGSTDGSSIICDEYQEADPRVRAFHKQNGGICSARNYGLERAHGEYVGFCDHDDVMMPNCLERCMEVLRETGTDMVRFRRRKELRSETGVRYNEPHAYREQTIDHMDWGSYSLVERLTGHGVWVGLYRREMLEENAIRYREQARYGYEDHIFLSECCAVAADAVLIPDLLYVWVCREERSTSMKADTEAIANRLESILLWARTDVASIKRLHAKPEDYRGRALSYLWHAIIEIDRIDMDYRGKRRGLDKFQIALESCFDGISREAWRMPRGQSIRDGVKNWCAAHGAVRAYHLIHEVMQLAI